MKTRAREYINKAVKKQKLTEDMSQKQEKIVKPEEYPEEELAGSNNNDKTETQVLLEPQNRPEDQLREQGKYTLLIESILSSQAHESLFALQELSEVLSIATEDMFMRSSFGLSPNLIVKNLIFILNSNLGELGAEQKLMALRCLFNLIEAYPLCMNILVQSKGVESLVDKLMEIEFIDLAEIVMKILERTSKEFPASVLRANGMFASLQYIDFFGIHVQRNALSIVSNCLCSLPAFSSNIGIQIFEMVQGIIDILVRLLHYPDLKIVESACTSILNISRWVARDQLSNLFTSEHLNSISTVLRDSFTLSNQRNVFMMIVKIIGNLFKSSCLLTKLSKDFQIIRMLTQFVDMENYGNSIDQNTAILTVFADLLPALPISGVWKVVANEDSDNKVEVDSEVLEEIKTTVFPILTTLFLNYSNVQIRKTILMALCKFVFFYNDETELERVLKECKVPSVLFELIHYQDSGHDNIDEKILILGGLCLTNIVIEKCGDELKEYCIRQGIPGEIKKLLSNKIANENASEEEKATDNLPTIVTLDTLVNLVDRGSSISYDENRLSGIRQALFGNSSRRGIINWFTPEKFSESELSSRIWNLAEEIDNYMESSSDLPVSGEKLSEKIMNLQVNIKRIGTKADVTSADLGIIQSFIECMLADFSVANGGITSLELFTSNLVEFLIDFISAPSIYEKHVYIEGLNATKWTLPLSKRIEIFVQIAFFPDATKLKSLIELLEEYIARLERYPILSSSKTDSGVTFHSRFHLLTQVSQQVKLILEYDGDSTDFSTCQVTIPAIGSFQTLESYIKARISPNGSTIKPIEIFRDSLSELENSEMDEEFSEQDEMDFDIESTSDRVVQISDFPKKNGIEMPRVSSSTSKECMANDHITFYVNDKVVDSQDTVFSVLYNALQRPIDVSEVWSTTHRVTFKISSAPYIISPEWKSDCNCECELCSTIYRNVYFKLEDCHSLELNLSLILLSLLNAINSNADIFDSLPNSLSNRVFINNKVSAKVWKQIAQPLMSISNIYPAWAKSFIFKHSYLLSFETRKKFFRQSGMGHYRNMTNYLRHHDISRSSERQLNFLRSDRLKVKISRENIFEEMCNVLKLAHGKCVLEFEFLNEAGSGLGPTLEFFTLVSESIRAPKGLRLNTADEFVHVWRSMEVDSRGFLNPTYGLYPRPCSDENQLSYIITVFEAIGEFVARAVLDSRQLDLLFSRLLLIQAFHYQNCKKFAQLFWLKMLDEQLYKSLSAMSECRSKGNDIGELAVDFVLPGYPEYELIECGESILVNNANFGEYMNAVLDATLGKGVNKQIDAFRRGFFKLIPVNMFACFTIEEIESILCGERNENWTFQELCDSILADHGYNSSSKLITQICEMLSEFDPKQKRDFLSFCTGSPKLPLGGFKELNPRLTIVRKTVANPDECLPSVMTCAHYLKVPEYSSAEMLKKRFIQAITDGKGSFHLS